MILPESRSLEWIKKVAKQNRPTNPILVEKVIRAFSLLESLARSGCPFIFKGGSSLMLHFGSSRRLSIDVDIICPPGKGTRNCSMEIMKQMFDIASLFNVTDDMTWSNETYRKLGLLEMEYRHIESKDIKKVAEDTIATALCISTNGYGNE